MYLVKKILKYKDSKFLRNVFVVLSGTAVAQIITIAFSPIITRLYGPEVFGLLGAFTALTHTLSPLAGLSYPSAIVLPQGDTEAHAIVRLSRNVSFGVALFLVIIVFFVGNNIAAFFNLDKIGNFIYLVPITIIFASYYQSSQQLMLRKKLYKLNAQITVIQAILLNTCKSVIGFFFPTAAVLVGISAVDNALLAAMQSFTLKKEKPVVEEAAAKFSLWYIAKKYYDFPVYRTPQSLINIAAQSLPVLLLASFFGPSAAGFYSLGRKILSIPTTLIGRSVGNVFYPHIAEVANKGKSLSRPLLKTTLALAVAGIVPFGAVSLFGPWVFGFVFGKEWIKAGEYARWISLYSFFIYINRPTILSMSVLSLQRLLLFYEILSTLVLAAGILIGFYVFSDDLYAIIVFSVISIILNIIIIIFVFRYAVKYDHTRRNKDG
jgi:O-antigen/teichoic acid export membrane protein